MRYALQHIQHIHIRLYTKRSPEGVLYTHIHSHMVHNSVSYKQLIIEESVDVFCFTASQEAEIKKATHKLCILHFFCHVCLFPIPLCIFFSTLLGATTLLAGLVHNDGGRVIGSAIIALITNLFSSRSPLQSFF